MRKITKRGNSEAWERLILGVALHVLSGRHIAGFYTYTEASGAAVNQIPCPPLPLFSLLDGSLLVPRRRPCRPKMLPPCHRVRDLQSLGSSKSLRVKRSCSPSPVHLGLRATNPCPMTHPPRRALHRLRQVARGMHAESAMIAMKERARSIKMTKDFGAQGTHVGLIGSFHAPFLHLL